jgi:hypothetical protein
MVHNVSQPLNMIHKRTLAIFSRKLLRLRNALIFLIVVVVIATSVLKEINCSTDMNLIEEVRCRRLIEQFNRANWTILMAPDDYLSFASLFRHRL